MDDQVARPTGTKASSRSARETKQAQSVSSVGLAVRHASGAHTAPQRPDRVRVEDVIAPLGRLDGPCRSPDRLDDPALAVVLGLVGQDVGGCEHASERVGDPTGLVINLVRDTEVGVDQRLEGRPFVELLCRSSSLPGPVLTFGLLVPGP